MMNVLTVLRCRIQGNILLFEDQESETSIGI